MTRTDDVTVPLEARIKGIRRVSNADLFISIHTNASEIPLASGIETYFLHLTTDSEAIRNAAMQIATDKKNIADMEVILTDLTSEVQV